MKKRKNNQSNKVLEEILGFLNDGFKMLPAPFETPYAWIRRAGSIYPHKNYYNTVRAAQARGYVKIKTSKGQQTLQLTKKGQLRVLFGKAGIDDSTGWDGRWRVFIFDFPESSRVDRNMFRKLLKKNKFFRLQHSVYISPYSLNHEAVEYLRESKLIDYIRIMRVDEMDYEQDLLKKFHLKARKKSDKKL